MRQSSQQKSPRSILQYSRNDQIPKLISINQPSKENYRDHLLQQTKTNTRPKTQGQGQLLQLRRSLQGQRSENDQLRHTVGELTRQLSKLRQINEGLIDRIKQIQVSYRHLHKQLEKSHQSQKSQLKGVVYGQIQEYIKKAVQSFRGSLRQQKLSISLLDKLDIFIAEIVQINPVAVQHKLRGKYAEEISHDQSPRIRNDKFKQFITQHALREDRIKNRNETQTLQFSSIMQRLGDENRLSKSPGYEATLQGSYERRKKSDYDRRFEASYENRLRNGYATTPQKRKKIFS